MDILEKLKNIITEATGEMQDMYEFAINRKKVKDKIEDWSDVIVDHICKIIYLRDRMPSTVHHWCAEINAKMENIVQIQMKGGDLKQSTLVEWMRNGLTSPTEMEDRRHLVAMQEKINIDICKELDAKNDYKLTIHIVEDLVQLIIQCRKEHRLPIVKDIEDIVNANK